MKSNKPNGVLFKTNDNKLVICKINDGVFDWDHVMVLKKEQLDDKYDDISASNPFEFVFCYLEDDRFTTFNQKSVIPDYSLDRLIDEKKLELTIETDYENQFGE